MTIYLGSRYENSIVDFVATDSSEAAAPVVRYSFGDLGRVSYTSYTWNSGDRLDYIAFKAFGYSEMWWLIPYYNPEIKDFQNIPDGTVLRIPHV